MGGYLYLSVRWYRVLGRILRALHGEWFLLYTKTSTLPLATLEHLWYLPAMEKEMRDPWRVDCRKVPRGDSLIQSLVLITDTTQHTYIPHLPAYACTQRTYIPKISQGSVKSTTPPLGEDRSLKTVKPLIEQGT